MDFPRTSDEITPEWLTRVLRESGAISDATVESFVFENIDAKGSWSEVELLVPEYSAPESGGPRGDCKNRTPDRRDRSEPDRS